MFPLKIVDLNFVEVEILAADYYRSHRGVDFIVPGLEIDGLHILNQLPIDLLVLVFIVIGDEDHSIPQIKLMGNYRIHLQLTDFSD